MSIRMHTQSDIFKVSQYTSRYILLQQTAVTCSTVVCTLHSNSCCDGGTASCPEPLGQRATLLVAALVSSIIMWAQARLLWVGNKTPEGA